MCLLRFKKFIACSVAAIVATVGVFSGSVINASAADTSDIFDYNYSDSVYQASFKGDYLTILQNQGATEVIYPETYNDGTNGEAPVTAMTNTNKDEYITSITYNKQKSNISLGMLGNYYNLTTAKFLYDGTDFSIGNRIVYGFSTTAQSTSLEKLYIYAYSLSSCSASAFQTINDKIQIYVANESVKEAIVSATEGGSYPVSADQITVMTAENPKAEFTITCKNINFGEKEGFSPQPNIVKADEGAEITYKLYTDAECKNEASYAYNSPYLPVGVYYLKGFMAATDNYSLTESEAVKVEVLKLEAISEENLKALNDAIAAANTFYEENQYHKDDFDTTAWNAVYRSPGALSKAQDIVAAEEGSVSNDEAVEATKNLTEALEALKTASADLTESWESLSKLITQAEEIVAKVDNGEVKYTEETYEKLTKELKSAKDLLALKDTEESVTKSRIQSRIDFLQAAIDGLEKGQNGVEPGKPFSYIQKGGKAANVASLTADKDMAGVTKIKLTFDCAEDVSFNEYATIDVDATVAGTQSYKQFAGNNYTEGGTNFVELPLTAAVKEGDSIELKVSTWSWDNAKDYVYGITKVEFINDKGEIAHTIIDKDIFKESLTASIADAEKINTSVYTEESVAALTKAIEAAKALADDATAKELEKAIQDIDEAIKGLTKKTSGPDKTDDGKTEDSTTKVIGTAKGKTFTVGNFQYKVTVAATITGTKKAAGKVTVVGLTKTGKKKSSISVKNTVSKSGAAYSVTAIASKAFKKATKLKKATLGTNVKAIPTSAFEGCKKLTTVSAKGVTKIGKKSFKNCKALKKLTLKKKVSVKKGAFKGCKKTIKVTGASKKVNKANVKKLKKSGYKKFK